MRKLHLVLFVASLLAFLPFGIAQTYTFTGTGNWSNPALWSSNPSLPPNSLPSGSAIVIDGICTQDITRTIGAGASLTVNATRSLTINMGRTLTISGSMTNNGAVSISGTLTDNNLLTNNGTLVNSSNLNVSNGDNLFNNGTLTNNSAFSMNGSLTNSNLLTNSSGAALNIGSSDSLYNNGTLNNSGELNIQGRLTNNDQLTNTFGGEILIGGSKNLDNNGALTNQGEIIVNGTLYNADQLTNTSTGLIDINGGRFLINTGTVNNSGTITNDGNLTNNNQFYNLINGNVLAATGGADNFINNATTENDGLITCHAIMTNSGSLTNNGIVSMGNSGSDQFFHNGDLENNGTFNWVNGSFTTGASSSISGTGLINTSGATLVSNGALSPGASPGSLIIAGNLSITGSLDIELGGYTPGTQYDVLVVTGTVTINAGADLNVSLINSFIPVPPDQFQILTWLTHLGTTFTESFPGMAGAMIANYNTFDLTLEIVSALPVTWLNFRATLNEKNGVDLLWSTASESNNEGFDIERSANGRDWETLAFVPGSGTTSEIQTYQYTDSSPFTLHSSPLYYRLKQTDFSGSFEYSPIRIVEIRSQNDIRVFPNPADEEITIAFSQPTGERGLVQLFNQQGRLVVEEPLSPQTNEHQLRISSLPAGIYILRATVGREQWVKRVVVK